MWRHCDVTRGQTQVWPNSDIFNASHNDSLVVVTSWLDCKVTNPTVKSKRLILEIFTPKRNETYRLQSEWFSTSCDGNVDSLTVAFDCCLTVAFGSECFWLHFGHTWIHGAINNEQVLIYMAQRKTFHKIGFFKNHYKLEIFGLTKKKKKVNSFLHELSSLRLKTHRKLLLLM